MTFGAPPAAEPPAPPSPPCRRRSRPPRSRRPRTTGSRRRVARRGDPHAAATPPETPAAPEPPEPETADEGFETFAAPGAAAAAGHAPAAPDTRADAARRRAAAGHRGAPRRAGREGLRHLRRAAAAPAADRGARAAGAPSPSRSRPPPRRRRARSTTRTPARRPRCRARSTATPARPRRCRRRSAPAGPARRRKRPRSLDEEPEPREPRERRNLAFPIAIAGALVVAVVLGLLLGGGGGGEEKQAAAPPSIVPEQPVQSGSIALEVPKGWQELATPPEIPGLALTDAAAYAPGGRDGGKAVEFGMAKANDSTLLPPKFRRPARARRRRGARAHAGQARARRHPGLPLRGPAAPGLRPHRDGLRRADLRRRRDGRLPGARPRPPRASARSARGSRTRSRSATAKPFPVGPNPAYAKTLNRTLNQLDRRVAAGRAALARDGATFRAQARAAGDIQAAYAEAARKLKQAETSPADATINDALVERPDRREGGVEEGGVCSVR